ncbi:S9 family peptidase [Hymenobacter saemangeumensis]|uniref:S9 family peptidase n=1 Tax=Hymenobacter saemangeumensis TaxID=1084522 RepID=A0ABP8HYY6_9BACT
MRFRTLALALLLASNGPALLSGQPSAALFAQQKQALSLEDIWASGKLLPRTVPGFDWMKDGRYYAALVNNEVVQHEVTTGKAVQTLVPAADLKPAGQQAAITINGYVFNADEQKLLLSTQTEPIYRHSQKAYYYVYDRASKKLVPLSQGDKQGNATFSPDGRMVAFTRDNNLYVVDLATMTEKAVTSNGAVNKIINGSTDWVYEEEFGFAKGYDWSPDSKQLAYYTFDESRVPEYNMQEWGPLYPKDYRYKYPKAGEKNSIVSISAYDLGSGRSTRMDLGPETDQYIPRMMWTQTPGLLSMQRLNRLQNKLEILHGDPATGKTTVVLTDTNPAYVEINDDLRYLEGGKQFLFTSEQDGYQHLYLYDISGKLIRQVTKGPWEISAINGFDPKAGVVYYTSTEASPLERHLYRISLKGTDKVRISDPGHGIDKVNMSPDTRYFLNDFSKAGTPSVISLREGRTGKLVKVLEDNAKLRETLGQYAMASFEFFKFSTADGQQLNGWMMKPADFDPSKKYPVLMYCYGGPSFGSSSTQTVLDNASGGGGAFNRYLWNNYLTQQGYIVVSVEGRGSSGRGAAFRKATYANLGKYEAIDQGAGAKHLGTLPYVDKSRIGLWGWSFGGYLTALAITTQPELFKLGIAVAPVTNWRYYDTVYTERYLKTPQLNPGGYDDNSPVQHAAKLKAKFLLVHGTGDDNVHFQNSVAFTDALIAANKDFQTLYYPNRNHSIRGGNTSLHLYRQMTNFIQANL